MTKRATTSKGRRDPQEAFTTCLDTFSSYKTRLDRYPHLECFVAHADKPFTTRANIILCRHDFFIEQVIRFNT